MKRTVPAVCFDGTTTHREEGIITMLIWLQTQLLQLSSVAEMQASEEDHALARCEVVRALMQQHFPDLRFYVEDSTAPPESPRHGGG